MKIVFVLYKIKFAWNYILKGFIFSVEKSYEDVIKFNKKAVIFLLGSLLTIGCRMSLRRKWMRTRMIYDKCEQSHIEYKQSSSY